MIDVVVRDTVISVDQTRQGMSNIQIQSEHRVNHLQSGSEAVQ
jgi:hypothetical protein